MNCEIADDADLTGFAGKPAADSRGFAGGRNQALYGTPRRKAFVLRFALL